MEQSTIEGACCQLQVCWLRDTLWQEIWRRNKDFSSQTLLDDSKFILKINQILWSWCLLWCLLIKDDWTMKFFPQKVLFGFHNQMLLTTYVYRNRTVTFVSVELRINRLYNRIPSSKRLIRKIYYLKISSTMGRFVCWTNKLIKITSNKPKRNTMKVLTQPTVTNQL